MIFNPVGTGVCIIRTILFLGYGCLFTYLHLSLKVFIMKCRLSFVQGHVYIVPLKLYPLVFKLNKDFIFTYLHTYIIPRPFSFGVSRDHLHPFAAILTHTFRFFYFQVSLTCLLVSGTLDQAFF
jgi:hypothetical protein